MKGGKSTGAQKKSDAKLAVKKGKAAKDPNKPKRPASAFFVFMEEFRDQFKAENPHNKSVAAVSKAGGVKWKAMSTSVSGTLNISSILLKVFWVHTYAFKPWF
ncbi:putative chromatin remodeling & transcriptional activation HMG family [Helianthus annuus]|nr:putative chromatin remodeling & transcriptional activation HMG family [Helianthus annuus]